MPLLTKGKNADSAGDQSMHFWGVCCESGKQYAQVVGQRFRITMAVLDPKSYSKEDKEKTVSLVVIRGGIEYLLCILKHEEIHQVNLNLIFDKGENVVFYINGHGKVYLSGYQLTDSESDVVNDENGYLCPLVEVKSPKSKLEKKVKGSKTQPNKVTKSFMPSGKKKADVLTNDLGTPNKRAKSNFDGNLIADNSKIDSKLDPDDSDDEEQSESEDDSEESEDEPEDEEQEDEEDDEEDEEEEHEEIVYSKGSQKKRKLEKMLQPQKRSKYDSSTSTHKDAEKPDVICLDEKDSSDSDPFISSVGNTPMPKKQSTEKKKPKKKKKLTESSDLSGKSVKGLLKSPVAQRTPNSEGSNVQKLEGGVEFRDLIIGKGPAATTGKMVHIFYVGRLPNKEIFDSRLPGKKPFSFKLGAKQVIKGLDIGIVGMKSGGKRKLTIPSNMGYGSTAIEGIPPNSMLTFIVDLQNVS